MFGIFAQKEKIMSVAFLICFWRFDWVFIIKTFIVINIIIVDTRKIINEKFKYFKNLKNTRTNRPTRETRLDNAINDSIKDLTPMLITEVSSRLFFDNDFIKFDPLRNIKDI